MSNTTINSIINIFKEYCNYKTINKLTNLKLRNSKINLQCALFYRFAYSQINITKEHVVSRLNLLNHSNHTRQGFDSKEANIPVSFYKLLLDNLAALYNSTTINQFKNTIIAIDGTYNNDNKYNQMLNMGFYNVSNCIPIDIKSFGSEGKNKEVKSAIDYITKNIQKFKDTIIIGDRAYFTYDFMKFLDDNGIYFIIRARGDAMNLDTTIPLKKYIKDRNTILHLRTKIRLTRCKSVTEKIVHNVRGKKDIKSHKILLEQNLNLLTNLNANDYPNESLIEIYKSRWDIEVFFKYLKNNCKFQHMKETDKNDCYEKTYLCELIIIYIAKLIEKDKIKDKNQQINESHLLKGIYDTVLYDVLHDDIDNKSYNDFCEIYIKKINNKKNRSYPRTSKTPFTKWYVKGYSEHSKLAKIINAILNKTTHKLNNNQKSEAKRIKEIDGEKCTYK